MSTPGRLVCSLAVLCLFLSACSRQVEEAPAKLNLASCHIIYDAGSAETRLYVYQQTDSGWLKHSGPKVAALADPVRAIGGETMADAGAVVDTIVAALESIRSDGPPDSNSKPQWPAFDWQEDCDLQTASVFATAGMRLAEQKNPIGSESLWDMLNHELKSRVNMNVTTRTLSGYEEGLFAWLAEREGQDGDGFGVVEMGGASIQVVFPCSQCDGSRLVRVKGGEVEIFSHSFLGWGQNIAWQNFGFSAACERGAGVINPEWAVSDCSIQMTGFTGVAIEPLKRIRTADIQHWFLSGAFRYMNNDDIDSFCRRGQDSGFQPESSCFRAVYLREVIEVLGLPVDTKPGDADWTLGAVICTATQCLGSD
jgi:hypothetical protein